MVRREFDTWGFKTNRIGYSSHITGTRVKSFINVSYEYPHVAVKTKSVGSNTDVTDR